MTVRRAASQHFDQPQYAAYAEARRLDPEALDAVVEAVSPFLVAGGLLADIGSGTGRFGAALRRSGVRYVAVEPSAQMRLQADAPGPTVAALAEALPFAADSVDHVFLSMVVHHLDLPQACAEFERVLRARGSVIVRNHFRGRLQGVPVYEWFPAAAAADERRLPGIDDVLALLPRCRWSELVTVVHRAAPSLRDFRERVRMRSASVLQLVSDTDFHEGLQALDGEIARTGGDEPVPTRVDILVAGR